MATQAEAARHLFVSTQAFRDMIDRGVVTRRPPDGYDLNTVRREALTHLRAQAAGRGASKTLSRGARS
jgi:hypothetical protein